MSSSQGQHLSSRPKEMELGNAETNSANEN